jgi:hypothetical protein
MACLPVGVKLPLAVSFILSECVRSCLPAGVSLIFSLLVPALGNVDLPVATSSGLGVLPVARWACGGTRYQLSSALPAPSALNETV